MVWPISNIKVLLLVLDNINIFNKLFKEKGEVFILSLSYQSFDDIRDIIANNAGAHNAFYRGKDITALWQSGQYSINVANGSFKDIFPGDFIQADITYDGNTVYNMVFYIMHLDYYYGSGSPALNQHACVLMPARNLTSAYMNSTNTAAGGYIGSYMYKTIIPKCASAIRSAFGESHIPVVNYLYPKSFTSTTNGTPTDWGWYSAYCSLPTESMLYGGPVWSVNGFEQGIEVCQLAAMRHNRNIMKGIWTRNVAQYNNDASSYFCARGDYGSSGVTNASISDGVRPAFNLT